jgi:hypothetical protein
MKKIFFVILFLNSLYVFSDNSAKLNTVIQNIAQEWNSYEIVILDERENYYLIKVNYNEWQSTGYFLDLVNEKNYLLKNEPGHIISLKFYYIDYLNKEIIEMVESTNGGNGNIHIFDYNLNVLLSEYFYDSHGESLGYSYFHDYKLFSEIKYREGDYLNIYFRDNYSLNIDYNEILRIFGYRDYILSNTNNGDSEIVLSQRIDNYYIFNNDANKFEIVNEISTGKYFEWWDYVNE